MATILHTDNDKDLLKRRIMSRSAVSSVVDTGMQFDPLEVKLYAVAHTPHDKLPAFAGLMALLAVHGHCRLHEYDDFAKKWNTQTATNKLAKIDTNDDNILRSVYALFDVAYLDDTGMLIVDNRIACGKAGEHWWHKYIACLIKQEFIDELLKLATTIECAKLIL